MRKILPRAIMITLTETAKLKSDLTHQRQGLEMTLLSFI